MSDKTTFLRLLEEVYRSAERMTQRLLENPSCVDGKEKKEAYSIASEYFKKKKEKTKSKQEANLNNAHVIMFEMMLENYTYASYDLEYEHAKQIALHIARTSESGLKVIPQDLKDEAFDIIFRYLEHQMDS